MGLILKDMDALAPVVGFGSSGRGGAGAPTVDSASITEKAPATAIPRAIISKHRINKVEGRKNSPDYAPFILRVFSSNKATKESQPFWAITAVNSARRVASSLTVFSRKTSAIRGVPSGPTRTR